MAENGFILCEGLVKIYKVANLEVVALQGLDLSVARGELLGIVGASGSGKSTLMNILGGLDRPSAGRVWVDGSDLLKMSNADLNGYRRTKVGFVWQQGARNLISYLSALENVKLPMTLAGQTPNKERGHAEALLEVVGLAERKHHRLIELSGGEQQRVAIAVALANSPTLLLADEPTGEVDSVTAAGIFKVFQDLNKQYGLTTLIVSHDQGIAHYMNRVVAIRDGKTSSETVRQTLPIIPKGDGLAGGEEGHGEIMFEELVILDSAGRLQVPRDYLERLNIKDRARLELVDGGILIQPVQISPQEVVAETASDNQEAIVDVHGPRGWWNRLRNTKKRTKQQ